MINADYNSMYGQFLNARNSGRIKGKAMDKSKLSQNMDYLEKAQAKVDQAKGKTTKKTGTSGTDKTEDGTELTREDLQKLYAELNGINYGAYDGKDCCDIL